MAMSGTQCGNEAAEAMGVTDPLAKADIGKLAKAVIDHIIQNAVITISAGSVATGVTAGPAAVPVTGTAKIT